ncbi:MAG: SRPBCC domain-containing protein [Chloroflexi bacterium]|nr:SRPBCC domain-containing protein [Chloroflexota bacterium]
MTDSHADASAPRHHQFEVSTEIHATPEAIWQAIATGPGVTLWFTRMEIEEFVGGKVVADPNQPVAARVTVWEPPHRFSYAFPESAGPHAWEFSIEPDEGETCTLRLVDSWFTAAEKEDDFSAEVPTGPEGWQWAFEFLAHNVRYFPGQRGASVQVMWPVAGTFAESWRAFREALALPPLHLDTEIDIDRPDAPRLHGRAVGVDERILTALIDTPMPGIAWLATGGGSEAQSFMMVHINVYGPGCDDVAAREQAVWQGWLAQTFPRPAAESTDHGSV